MTDGERYPKGTFYHGLRRGEKKATAPYRSPIEIERGLLEHDPKDHTHAPNQYDIYQYRLLPAPGPGIRWDIVDVAAQPNRQVMATTYSQDAGKIIVDALNHECDL